jgi:hypothetical protein
MTQALLFHPRRSPRETPFLALETIFGLIY